jgi:hypothetical protein
MLTSFLGALASYASLIVLAQVLGIARKEH